MSGPDLSDVSRHGLPAAPRNDERLAEALLHVACRSEDDQAGRGGAWLTLAARPVLPPTRGLE